MPQLSKNFINISANTIQIVINQLLGILIFYVLSNSLSKTSFGQLNWALAVMLTVCNVLSCGIDQLTVKKVAANEGIPQVFNAYLVHVLLSGICFYGILLIAYRLFPQQHASTILLLSLGAGKLLNYFSTPFKQLAAGKEQFGLLARMSMISNIIKGIGLLIALWFHHIDISVVIALFIAGDITELLGSLWLYHRYIKIDLNYGWNGRQYIMLVKEALPQVGVVLFTSALSRFDWIFIGLFMSPAKLAEYSFAYKAFEISTTPLLVIAPLLVPKFVHVTKHEKQIPVSFFKWLQFELAIAICIGLVLNLCWSPLVDVVTGYKYGAVNANVTLLLSICAPLLYINNFLWSICFAQGKMKFILRVFAITFVANLIADVTLIPLFGNNGAAAGYLLAMLVQCIMYLSCIPRDVTKRICRSAFACYACSILSACFAKYFIDNVLLLAITGTIIYAALMSFSKIFTKNDLMILKQFVKA